MTSRNEMSATERVSRAIARRQPDRVPTVALMIHHAIRLARLGYDQCARDPAMLVRAHLEAWKAYGYDGFHVTCDNWVLPAALGCGVQFFPDQPPTASARVLADTKDLARLTPVRTGTEGRLGFKVEATRLAREAVGDRCHLRTCFDSGPFSLATALRGIEQLMIDCLDDPPFVLDLLEICTDAVIRFARACGGAGCHALTFGDSTAGLLSRPMYERFAYPYQKRVIAGLKDLGLPVFLHICGDTSHIQDLMAATGADGLEVDYQHDIASCRRRTADRVCLQGNIAPAAVMLAGTPEQVAQACQQAIVQSDPAGGFILSAGCEIPRDTPPANLHAMVQSARQTALRD